MANRKALVGQIDPTLSIIAHDVFEAGDALRDPAGNTIVKPAWFYGAGSLGDVVITEDTTLSAISNYNNLTVAAGVTVTVNNYFTVKGRLTLGDGASISRNGPDTVGRVPGAAGSGTFYALGGAGASGRSGLGNGFSSGSITAAFGGRGGRGGESGAYFGANAGALTAPTAAQGGTTALSNVVCLSNGRLPTAIDTAFNPGNGGGSGASSSTVGEGGGGGAGGAVLVVFAHEIVVPTGAAVISANGGKGGDGVASDGAGAAGGAGGGGGVCIVVSSFDQPAGLSVQANGGAGGLGVGIGLTGANGSPGLARYYKWS